VPPRRPAACEIGTIGRPSSPVQHEAVNLRRVVANHCDVEPRAELKKLSKHVSMVDYPTFRRSPLSSVNQVEVLVYANKSR
jgi:hypothetical protein